MVKRKHYDQNCKEALVAEMLTGTSAAKIAQREALPHTHFISGKKKSRVAIESLIEKHEPIGYIAT